MSEEQFERDAADRYRAMIDTGSALDRLMRRARTPLKKATWSKPGDLRKMSIEAMERREN